MKRWKNELRKAFEAPSPQKKQQFLMTLPQPKLRLHEFALSQLGYIRKRVWCVSALVFTVLLMQSFLFPADAVWFFSALTPILALMTVTESGRSERFEMAELEQVTRFSLRSVVLARLLILGTENFLLLCLLIPVSLRNGNIGTLRAGLYILTPFLLTSFICLVIVRKVRGQEYAYYCVGTAIGIGALAYLMHMSVPQAYGVEYLHWWIVAALVFCFGMARQLYFILNRTEELAWNF